MIINDGKVGELDLKLFNELTAIHYGEKEDTHNWIVKVEKKSIEV
jgi:branched-chain amino acid aminotransferase